MKETKLRKEGGGREREGGGKKGKDIVYCVLDLGDYPVILLFVCKFGIVASACVCIRQAETLGRNYIFNSSGHLSC